jgi:Bacterial PH domain
MAIAEHEDPRLQSALATIEKLLTSGETIEAWATQRRLFSLKNRRIVLVATSGRFIALTRRLIAGYDTTDIRWQDLKETHIRAGVFGADITLVAQSSSDLNISAEVNRSFTYDGLRKDQAQDIYRICQQHDQAWREKRRIRELEELRAKSGGFQFAPGAAGAASAGAASSEATAGGYGAAANAAGQSESARRLRQAREMLDARLITDSEYEAIKAKIVAGL